MLRDSDRPALMVGPESCKRWRCFQKTGMNRTGAEVETAANNSKLQCWHLGPKDRRLALAWQTSVVTSDGLAQARVNTRKASPSRGLGRPGGITFRGAGKVGSD